MLKGRFGDTTGRPFIEARIVLPQQKAFGNVSFVLDTGADRSLLMPLDAQRCNIDWDQLERTESSSGIGGQLEHYVESAIVAFTSGEELYLYSIELGISPPSVEIMKLPSLLGRDIIDQWRITYDKPSMTLTADVVAADATYELKVPEAQHETENNA